MSVIATAVRHLMAAGVTGDALLVAIEELEADVRAEPKPKSPGAIRTERWRQRHKASHVTKGDVGDESDADPALSPAPNENNSNPHPHTHPDITTPREAHVLAWLAWRETHPFPRPWWADKRVWADWLEVRKAKKARNTITAHNGFLRDIDKHADAEWPPGRLLEHAVARSWLSINRPEERPHYDRLPTRQPNLRRAASTRGDRPNPCLDMLYAAEAEIRAGENPQPDFIARPPLRAISSG